MNTLPLGLAVDLRTVVPYQTGSWRTLKPVYMMQTPPCTHQCPINNDIRGFLRALAQDGDYEQAWHIVTRTNPLPATCGRICHHPCEEGCNRRDLDEPLAINSVERCIGEYGLERGLRHARLAPNRREKVAVVGSGPAGLSCAFHLAKSGFQVKLFEAQAEPGGMMRYGIPAYRLPKDVLRQEIEAVLRLGIELECNSRIGGDIALEQLTYRYNAVFLGIGAQQGTSIHVPGETARNVLTGVEFLKRVNTGKPVEVGKEAVVIGGGNTGIDCARVAKRLGANVNVIELRTRVETAAITAEIDEALDERIRFRYNTSPVKIITDENRVIGVLHVQVEFRTDAGGRLKAVHLPGSESVLPADTVIVATGQAVDYHGIELDKRDHKWIETDEYLMTSVDRVFAGGDAVLGLETVAAAIGQGMRAAAAIEDYLEGSLQQSLAGPPVVYSRDLNTYYYAKQKRFHKEALPVHLRLKDFKEIYPPYDREEIIREAGRCMSCGLCFNCGNCLMYCPDNAVRLSSATGTYAFDYDFCKGCGLCARECPCHYIQMTLER
jgi:NADPH-dependent glutamate synthase beta subunit-like oxidoreductase